MSPTLPCVLSGLQARQRSAILKESLRSVGQVEDIEDSILLLCKAVQRAMSASQEEVEKEIMRLRSKASAAAISCAKILIAMTPMLYNEEPRPASGEASLTIEILRPLLNNCVTSRLQDVKFDWYALCLG